jgi:hypothetical protein
VVIHNFNLIGVSLAPRKTYSPLVIDTDTVLALSVAFQSLQSVPRQCCESPEIRRSIEHVQFPESLALNGLETSDGFPAEQALSVSAPERPDHS